MIKLSTVDRDVCICRLLQRVILPVGYGGPATGEFQTYRAIKRGTVSTG